MKKTRTDAEKRVDAAVGAEVARIDGIMGQLNADPGWVYSMGAAFGKTEMEAANGRARFSETLRSLNLEIQEMWNPEFAGASKLFARCDSLADRALNIKEIAGFIYKNKIDRARIDAEEGIFYQPDLTDFDTTRYRVLKQKLGFWQKFLPTRPVAIGSEETKYTMYEGTGATSASSPGKLGGVPYVGVRNERFTNPIESEAIGYMLTTDDQRKAAYANEPLIEELLMATKEAVGRTIDRSAWLGNLTLGLDGAINHPGVPNLQAALPASGTDRSWKGADKTNDEVYADIVTALSTIAQNTKEQFTPEDVMFLILLDRLTFDSLNRRMATGTDTTLRNFIKGNNNVQLGVLPQEFIAGTGPSGSDQALIYPFDPKVLRFRVNPGIIWAPMQWQDLTMKFPGEIIYGSVETVYPAAMLELFGI